MQEFSEVKTGTMSLISLDNDQHLFCLLLLEVSVSYLHVKSSTATVPISSLSWRNCYFPTLSSSFSFTSASPGMPVSMILVSFGCLSTKMMSGLLAGFNHPITLFMEIPYNFKTYYHYYYCLFDINLS